MLSALLQVPGLADPDFDQCVVEFKMNGNRVSTPVISFKGAAIQIAGKGTMNMESEAIAYDLNLALASSMLAKIPVQETRAAFKARGYGLSAVDSKVYGTSDAPKTDLLLDWLGPPRPRPRGRVLRSYSSGKSCSSPNDVDSVGTV